MGRGEVGGVVWCVVWCGVGRSGVWWGVGWCRAPRKSEAFVKISGPMSKRVRHELRQAMARPSLGHAWPDLA